MKQTKYDVFISYSRKDYVDKHKNVIQDNEVSKIKEALTNASISYWFDENGIYSGQDYVEKIVTNIEKSKILLFLSTVNSNKSRFTRREIACAEALKKHIIPVRIDSTPFNKYVLFHIADLDYIEYYTNPQKGLEDLLESIKIHLKLLKEQNFLKIKADKDCVFYLDGEEAGRLKAGAKEKFPLIEGEHELRFVSLENDADTVEKDYVMPNTDKFLKISFQRKKVKTNDGEKSPYIEKEPVEKLTFTVDDVSFNMIKVRNGTFLMGSPDSDPDAYHDEKPQHLVSMSDFYIGETQVTQALWEAIMSENPSFCKGNNRPVERVSWNDCQKFIKVLNLQCHSQLPSGCKFCLPTEAQWEYAARDGNKSHRYKYSGNNNIRDVAWYNENSDCVTHPVKLKKPNELGFYDMSGNVWEWCQDWHVDYSNAPQIDTQMPPSSSDRVLRGGSWCNNAEDCRVANRSHSAPTCRNRRFGIRLALVYQKLSY